MVPALPKIKPSSKLTQVDEATYSIAPPDGSGECVLDHPGYLVLEELEAGDKSIDEVAAIVAERYGLRVSRPQIEDFLRKLAHLGVLEPTLAELGISPGAFAGNSLEFRPGTRHEKSAEMDELLESSARKTFFLKKYDRRAWMKLGFGVAVFFMPWPNRASGLAEILPADDREIRSQVAGKIEEVLVKEGQTVAAGAPIARLAGYRDQLDRKRAEIAKIDAELDILRRGATREEIEEVRKQYELARQIERQSRDKQKNFAKLKSEGLVSAQEFEDVDSKWKIQVKELENVKARLDLIEKGTRPERIQAKESEKNALLVDLKSLEEMQSRSLIVSPIRGVIASPDTEKLSGRVVNAGDTLMKVANPDKLTILLEIPEKELGLLKSGQALNFKLQALPQKTFRTTVTRISPVVEKSRHGAAVNNATGNRVVRVYADMDNPDSRILPGMTGTGTIPLGWNSIGFMVFHDAFIALRLFFVF